MRTGLLLAAFAVAVLVWTLVRATLYGVVS
nr:hypothetical protein [Castellaniella caeni]